ncbi:hypothetical protein [Chelatococcus reniformis]|uniref:Uncharacterized protein n=1 Tax=Chelatococcus reniformis TaxID=1494448 RepID=A0A916X7B3_9HYPH|nr:hypothetical protein [Chelatococcus reniformis]GGC50923.1 hypothetical protein GCM10010994_07600 [Chelatococcus reniformis]
MQETLTDRPAVGPTAGLRDPAGDPKSEVERLAAELSDQRQHYEGLLAQLWQAIIDFRRDRASLTAEIEALRLRAESASAEFGRDRALLIAEIEALRHRVDSADMARHSAEAGQDHARAAHTQAADILHALYKSTSWRATRPIRGLKKLLAGQWLR